ncbi:MAG: murein biosynthesis integral membrane protein MurJ [Oscillospiraceae bacterium]|nr:murein biosynthesis integral membrane protein MurJ [Oscillospiraceae bacterium]
MENSGKKSVKAISLVMALTLIGKLLGLLRDRLLTVNYGSGMATNAFLTASRIPRVFFDAVFASAIAASFIPVFNELAVKKGRREADGFAGNFISVMALITLALTVLGTLFAEPLVSLFADGYDAETTALCVRLTRIMFPTVLFTGIAYSFVGILQSLDEFNVPALISVVSNALIILYFLIFNDRYGITGLAFAFLIGWLMQALVQIPSLASKRFSFHPSLSLRTDGMKKVFALMLPVMVSTWVQPINITINSKFGSRLFEGAGVSAIELSSNLYLIIVGVFVLSITNVIFPRLSRLSAGDEEQSFRETLRLTLHSTLYFVIPMTAGLMLLAAPIVSLIYGGGEFGDFSIGITSRALIFSALGMPGYAVQAVVCRAYFAEQNGRVPLLAGLASILVNIILCVVLIRPLDVAGLALASAAAISVNALLLLIPLGKRGFKLVGKSGAADAAKSVLSALVMAAAVWGIRAALGTSAGKIAAVLVPVVVGIAVYFAATLLLRLEEAKVVAGMAAKLFSVKKGS